MRASELIDWAARVNGRSVVGIGVVAGKYSAQGNYFEHIHEVHCNPTVVCAP